MDHLLESAVEGAEKRPLDSLAIKHQYGDDVRNVDLVACRYFAGGASRRNYCKAAQVAAEVGVGVQTLHYYERLGLLPKPNRSAANYRLYSPEAIRRVQFIKKAQAIGMTLEETKQILDLKDHGREPCRQVAELGEKHLREIDGRLTQLRAYRRPLAKSVSAWRKENLSERHCAGEFCDLIERLPPGRNLLKKFV